MAVAGTLRVVEANARSYRRIWRHTVIWTFLSPVLYLAAMGVGLGLLVNEDVGGEVLGGVSYIKYLAPGLLAASAMQVGAITGSFPVIQGIKWQRSYEAALATPIGPADLMLGHLLWIAVRLAMTTGVFLVVMIAFGAVTPLAGLSAVPYAILTGVACAALMTAFTCQLENHGGIAAAFRLGVTPLFLFSGTFFPISQLPDWMEPIAYATPLWHGVELARAAALGGTSTFAPLLHVGILGLFLVAGSVLAVRFLTRRMIR